MCLFFFFDPSNHCIIMFSFQKQQNTLFSKTHEEDLCLFQQLQNKQTPIDWSEMLTTPLQKVVLTSDLSRGIVFDTKNQVYLVSVHPTLRSWILVDLWEKKVPYRVLRQHKKTGCVRWLPHVSFFFTLLLSLSMLVGMIRYLLPDSPVLSDPFEKFSPASLSASDHTWIGSPEILQECLESIRETKGLLLEGEPGTGKTLLARKLASVSNATLIPVVGSQFIEVYVGVGAQRVRQLFAMAKKYSPSIIFLDEIDSIAVKRGASPHSHSENDQTLHQLLSEMDGFMSHPGIFVLGATNRVALMDPAILRPGRFDRVLHIPLPDAITRQRLLHYFLKSCPLPVSPGLDLDMFVSLTQDRSGADLQQIVREATVYARREGAQELHWNHLDMALEKQMVGVLKTEEDRTPEEILRVAVHETGHAMVAHSFSRDFRVRKISIRPNHDGVGGFTICDETFSSVISLTRDAMEKKLMVVLGGRAAEILHYGTNQVSAGALQDLTVANGLVETMFTTFGFSQRFPSFASSRRTPLSDAMRHSLHEEMQECMDRALLEAIRILNSTWILSQKVVQELVHKKSLHESAFLSLLTSKIST